MGVPEPSKGAMDGLAGSAAGPLRCLECRRPWTNKHDRWHAFIAEPERYEGFVIGGREVGVFCPDCSRQEFGEGAL
jgi:hypothetical protein